MKEELLKKAAELVLKCRKCYQDFEKAKKEEAFIGLRFSLFVSFIQSYWHYIGFCESLIMAGIFNLKDVEKMHMTVFLDSDTNLSSEVVDFINGLRSIDDI